MAGKQPHTTFEKRLAEQIARYGNWASIISLGILIIVCVSNLLIAVKVIAALTLAPIITIGPAISAITSGFSTFTTYFRRSRVLIKHEKLDIRDEANDVAMDQAGSALPVLTHDVASRFGCRAALAPLVFVASLILVVLTYGPSPVKIFGLNEAVTAPVIRVTATPTSSLGLGTAATPTTPVRIAPTPTPIPTPLPTNTSVARPHPTNTPIPPPTATPIPTPTATPSPTPTPAPPPPPTVSITAPQQGSVLYFGTSYTFTANARDGFGNPLPGSSVGWLYSNSYLAPDFALMGNANPLNFLFPSATYDPAGTYTIEAEVWDAQRQTNVISSITVTVEQRPIT